MSRDFFVYWTKQFVFYDDYPELQVVFTGSSLLQILDARADLSRRPVMYKMQGLSFREFLNIKTEKCFCRCRWN